MKTRLALLSLPLFSILILNIASASCTLPWPPGSFSISSSAILPLAPLALLMSFMVVGIGFIINITVPSTKLGPWLKNEYWEIAKSAMLIAMIFSLLIFLGNISLILTGGTTTYTGQSYSTINTIETNLATSAETSLYYAYCGAPPSGSSSGLPRIGSIDSFSSSIMSLAGGLGLIKTLVIGYYLPIPSFAGVPVPYFGSQFNIYKNPMLESSTIIGTYDSILNDEVMMLLIPVSMIIVIQYYLMPILLFLGMGLLIPFGVVFRAFPFLRGIGGTLIALGIGIAIIYPTVIVMINEPVTDAIGSTFNTHNIVSGSCAIPGGNFIENAFANLLCGIVGKVGKSNLVGIGAALGSIGTIYPALNLLSESAIVLLTQFFLFIFDLMIIFPLMDQVAKSLGGTIRLQLGGKLKIG